jgi:hypothetical protein
VHTLHLALALLVVLLCSAAGVIDVAAQVPRPPPAGSPKQSAPSLLPRTASGGVPSPTPVPIKPRESPRPRRRRSTRRRRP